MSGRMRRRLCLLELVQIRAVPDCERLFRMSAVSDVAGGNPVLVHSSTRVPVDAREFEVGARVGPGRSN